MAISVADNFSYQGTKPLDARVSFDTVAAMAAASDATLYDGCFAYVKAVKKYYSYDSTNEVDPTTGKWREYSSGGGGTGDYPDLTNKPSINGVELLGNKVIGLLSTNIQVDSDKIGYDNLTSGLTATNVKNALDELANNDIDSYPDLSNLPSINGTQLLGNKVIGLLSTNIQVDADKIGYDNTTSGLSANNVKSAIDALKSAIPQNVGKGQSGTGTDSEVFNDYTHNVASGNGSHAEGGLNTASGSYSHVEGYGNTASGMCSHAGGGSCVAATTDSFAHGMGVEVTSQFPTSVFAIGKYNNTTPGGSELFVIGNGTDSNNRSNILEVTDTALDVKGDVKHNGSNLITASTTDLTPGTSTLTTGNIYLVYE